MPAQCSNMDHKQGKGNHAKQLCVYKEEKDTATQETLKTVLKQKAIAGGGEVGMPVKYSVPEENVNRKIYVKLTGYRALYSPLKESSFISPLSRSKNMKHIYYGRQYQ